MLPSLFIYLNFKSFIPFAKKSTFFRASQMNHELDPLMAGHLTLLIQPLIYSSFDLIQAGQPAGEEDKPTKEYSRIRQLSADQYGSQYGLTHQDPSGQRPHPLTIRPLFA